MFHLIKKIFIGLLSGLINEFNHTKCVSLSNQICTIQSTLINLYPNKYSQEFHCYPLTVKLHKHVILLLFYLLNSVFQIKQKI